MRLTRAQSLLDRLLYGPQPPARRPAPARWVRTRPGRDTLRDGLARLAVGYALRHGGALEQTVFGAHGERLARGPLWDPAVAAVSEWRLSSAAAHWVVALADGHEGEPLPRPVTAADALLLQALGERLAASDLPRPRLHALRQVSPLHLLLAPDRAAEALDLTPLAPLLAAGWLLPYLHDHLVRSWLAGEARRRLLDRPEQEALNERWHALLTGLYDRFEAAARVEHLTLLCTFYAGWLRAAGGPAGLLHAVRQGSWEGAAQSARERYELSFGRLFEPALRLMALADELRRYGWERTPADEHFLGLYNQALEPHAPTLRGLHDELCRVV